MSKKHVRKSRVAAVTVLGMALVATTCAVCACAPQANPGIPTIKVSSPAYIPEADSYGVITADKWADQYPNEYNSYLENSKNVPYNYSEETSESADETSVGLNLLNGDYSADSEKSNYLETNPEIKTLGLGYGYAKFYTEPAGHTYSLYTVEHNGRLNENTKITCYACKTPQYNAQETTDLENGEDFYHKSFDSAEYTENISCANCHENEDPTQLKVTRKNWVVAMGDDADTVPLESQVCGQCHCDYSMDPVTGEPTSPYSGGLDSMDPDKALAWYDEHNYVDWTYESTGAQMIAVRHAEFEFYYVDGGSHMAQLGYTCADCHMGTSVDNDGNAYTNHMWSDPLENEELTDNDCSTCHEDVVSEVKAVQEDIDGRTKTLGERAEKFVKNFEDAINNKTITKKQKKKLQYVQRAACYYWNLAAAENSEGAHNPDLYERVLKSGNDWLDKGDAILGVSSQA